MHIVTTGTLFVQYVIRLVNELNLNEAFITLTQPSFMSKSLLLYNVG